MATHKVTMGIQGAGRSLTKNISYTNTGVSIIDGEQVAHGNDNVEFTFELDFSECKSFFLVSDQEVLFETNDGAAPTDTWTLLANEPYQWHENAYHTFLITGDITSIFISNQSGATATIYCLALYDPTP